MLEQFERTKRYLMRMEGIYGGIFSSLGHDEEAYDDDVISFFIHCYHVRDWIVHLNRVGIKAHQVDSYINNHRALRICADLANGSKHCKLTRSLRTDRQPHISGKERQTSTWLIGSGGGEVMKRKYAVATSSELIDALELARDCVRLWESYICAFESHNNQANNGTSL